MTEQVSTSKADVETLHERFVAGVNAHDVDALMALYEPDSLSMDLAGEPLPDDAALREFLTGFLAVAQRIEGETRRAYVSRDIALLSSSWRAQVTGEDGATVEMTGSSAEVARRQPDGRWLFVIDAPIFDS